MALISAKEAAKELGVSKGMLYALVRQRKIPFTKLGDRVLFDLTKLRAACDFEPEEGELGARPRLLGSQGRR